jgi:argininosuccinate lyase
MLRHVRFLVGEWRRHCPLGSGAVAGSSLAVNRQVQAEGLGFAGPSINALESTGCRDDCIELINLGAQLALHLQCLAADVILFSQTPLQWVVYPAGFGTGSSMMPNKLNPDAMELLRGEANAIVGAQAQAALLLKGLPSGYNRDLQCIKPLVRDVVERLHALCVLTLEFIGQLQFDPAKAAASTRAGAISATLAMEAKVREGLALRDAHHATAAEVAAGKLACSGTAADWIAAYQTAGSASPVETRSAARQILAGLEG